MTKLTTADRFVPALRSEPRATPTALPAMMRGQNIGDCFCPFTGNSVNVYALALAAARLTVTRAEQRAAEVRYLACCN